MKFATPPQRILILAPTFPPAERGGGPARTLEALVAQSPPEMTAYVMAPALDIDGTALNVVRNKWIELDRHWVYYSTAHPLLAYLLARRRMSSKPDLIYLNSAFNPAYSLIPLALRRLEMKAPPFLLAPRGEFDPGALALKPMKKRAFLRLARLTRIYKAVRWHASSSREAVEIARVIDPCVEIIVREDETGLGKYRDFGPLRPPDSDRLRVIFISRVSPKKGLHHLIEGLMLQTSKIDVDVYGPCEDRDYAARCRERALGLPKNVNLQYRGSIQPDVAIEVFSRSDVFIFPTAGENFGHVIAESFAGSCPIAVADVTPWTQRVRDGGGYVLSRPDAASVSDAIAHFARMGHDELARRRTLVHDQFLAWLDESKGRHVFSAFFGGLPDSGRLGVELE